ncbi:HAMP domain-containing histidine kinase [Peptoniphilus sp. KCTC 25270]|uniref:sensor histidine kinase n=1 Tax=Peptoniphilus sp. KCTC 25270 TaxID=2897414 RepID=UPI001E531546|nr:HAMP domain-containing histidine kinase [Peptoniphilus sp. KCTC 25270]
MAKPKRLKFEESIQARLIRNFVLIVIFTVVVLDISLLLGFKEYSYNGIQNQLNSEIESTSQSYKRFFENQDLDTVLSKDVEMIWTHFSGQVQIINTKGELVYDSIGAINDIVSDYSDVHEALKGNISFRNGEVNYSDSQVMSASSPLNNSHGDIIGVIRFTTSLDSMNAFLIRLSIYLLLISIGVIILSALFSYLFSRSIVGPLEEINHGAELMIDGQYKRKIEIENRDELGELANALNILSQEIVRKEQVKNDFISSISHELRTPLTSIRGWASVLKSDTENDPDLKREGLEIIETETERLANMVEELLDFSRYISGRITLRKEKFDLAETCSYVAKQMKPRAKNEGIEFIDETSSKPLLYMGDENKIKQLLINLIDNAIKFTDEKGWVMFESKESDSFFDIIISDNGVGISEDELELVKEKFYKGKHSKSHSGIGLSIADEIAKLHGGKIEIISKLGVGTTIRVRLPIKKRR